MAKTKTTTNAEVSAREKFIEASEQLKAGVSGYIDALTDFILDGGIKIEATMVDSIPVEDLEVLEATAVAAEEPKSAKSTKKTTKKAAKTTKVEEPEDEDDSAETGEFTAEQLDGMTYNDLKKLAKDLGIPAKGDRDTLTAKILGAHADADTSDDDDDDSVVEAPVKKSAKSTKKAPVKKSAAKKVEESEDEPEDDDAEDDDVAEDMDELEAEVMGALEDMTTEEIAELLSDSGLSPKGKRQALIDKVIKGVKDGVIDFDSDDEEEAEADENSDDDGEDSFGPNDPENPDMPEERADALEALDKNIRKQVKSKKLKMVTMKKELKAFYDGDDDALEAIAEMDNDEIVDNYIDMKQLFIDDDGDEVEEGAYSVNGVPYCCGRELTYNEDEDTYVCETCGSEYSADDED